TVNSLSLKEEVSLLQSLYKSISEKACAVDKSLEGFIGAEATKAQKSLGTIEKRLKKAEERNQQTAIRQLEAIKDKLFPGGALQERTDNYLNFYINNPSFIEDLLKTFDPFDYQFNILIQDE
ncbi:bacillithiol biosynthesis BshC, partial [Cytophagales bacterium RKSG123]